MRTAAPCSITARRRSSVPSTRPAANSTASSVNPSAEPSSYPQIPRTRHCNQHVAVGEVVGNHVFRGATFPSHVLTCRFPFLFYNFPGSNGARSRTSKGSAARPAAKRREGGAQQQEGGGHSADETAEGRNPGGDHRSHGLATPHREGLCQHPRQQGR